MLHDLSEVNNFASHVVYKMLHVLIAQFMNNYDNLKEAERKAGFPFVRYWQTVLDAVKDICTETEKM
jgi:hypothetical protein